jgi:hypothetical protein
LPIESPNTPHLVFLNRKDSENVIGGINRSACVGGLVCLPGSLQLAISPSTVPILSN